MADVNENGACPIHPVIQLRRRQRRTGEWKTILTTCPLCASGLPATPAEALGGVNNGGRGSVYEDDDDNTVSSRVSTRSTLSTRSALSTRSSTRASAARSGSLTSARATSSPLRQTLPSTASSTLSSSSSRSAVDSSSSRHRAIHKLSTTESENETDDDNSYISHRSALSSALSTSRSISSASTRKVENSSSSSGGGRGGGEHGSHGDANSNHTGSVASSNHSSSLLQQQQQQQPMGVRFHPETKVASPSCSGSEDGSDDHYQRQQQHQQLQGEGDLDESDRSSSSGGSVPSSQSYHSQDDGDVQGGGGREDSNELLNSLLGEGTNAFRSSANLEGGESYNVYNDEEEDDEQSYDTLPGQYGGDGGGGASGKSIMPPSALRPSKFGPSSAAVTEGSIVPYGLNDTNDNVQEEDDGYSGSRDNHMNHNSLYDVLRDGPSSQRHHEVKSHHNHRPPPPPRRDNSDELHEGYNQDLGGMMCHEIVPVESANNHTSNDTRRNSGNRMGRESGGSLTSNDGIMMGGGSVKGSAQHQQQQQRGRDSVLSSQRDSSTTRGRNTSRSRQPTRESSVPRPPPRTGRSRSRSRQPAPPSTSVCQPCQQPPPPPPPQQQQQQPVSILKNGRGNLPPMTSSRDEEFEHEYDEHPMHYQQQQQQSHSQQHMTPPNNRMREPPSTPQDDYDEYGRGRNNRMQQHQSQSPVGLQPHPNQQQTPQGILRGPPNQRERSLPPEHRRGNSAGMMTPNNNKMNNRSIPQAPRSGPVYLPSDVRDSSSIHSSDHGYNQPPMPTIPPLEQQRSPPPKKKSTRKERRHSNSQAGYTESETNPESSDAISVDNDNSDVMPVTKASEFDDKGRCVNHPHIRLRKKKMLGGWKVMLVNCPDCCIEEMLKMRRNGQDGNKGGTPGKSKSKNHPPLQRSPSLDSSNGSRGMPPISQLTIRNKDKEGDDDDERSISSGSSASEITYGTKTDYSRSSSGMQSWQNYVPPPTGGGGGGADNSGTSGSGPHRVTRMPFTDAYGDKGWYTGEVASGSGLPHGKGTSEWFWKEVCTHLFRTSLTVSLVVCYSTQSVHYCDGRMRSGYWSNGLAAGGTNASGSGNNNGGAGKGDSKKQGMRPSTSSNSVSSLNSHNRKEQQQQRRGVVCGLEWTDLEGHAGFYTGETDDGREPHGLGSQRYHDGRVLEGEWYHGEFERRKNVGGFSSSNANSSVGGGRGMRGDGSVLSNKSSGRPRGHVPQY